MNRWKNSIAVLLTVVMILTNSTVSYANTEKQDHEVSGTTVSGEGSENASSDASGDVSGEGQEEYVTICFYSKNKLVKTTQIKKGTTVELWEPDHTNYYVFKGWYYSVGENLGVFVNEYTIFNADTNLIASFGYNPNWRGPVAPINYGEKEEESNKIQKEVDYTRIQTHKASIKIKNITIKKKGKLSLKIRSTRMPQSPIELQYSTSKKFVNSKTKTKIIKRGKNTSVKKFKKVTIKKLKKNKTYYIRARIKSECHGTSFCSRWSKVIKVNMKGNNKQKKK